MSSSGRGTVKGGRSLVLSGGDGGGRQLLFTDVGVRCSPQGAGVA